MEAFVEIRSRIKHKENDEMCIDVLQLLNMADYP